jgi:hypothetical protein
MKTTIYMNLWLSATLFVGIILFDTFVVGQIDWAEDDDDPGKLKIELTKNLVNVFKENT